MGAGDSLMAGVLTALAGKQSLTPGRLGMLNEAALVSCLRFGAADASINCRRKGGQPPTGAEVDAVLAA
ncbi:hypothetical protein [Devosia psychrophila]|uniref:PfkB family carbohydrate kinase n=1 Tax=Devosia psychrophila TaxID=728005 RepID=A0A1I1QI84_9HYPH|nr:hypothetical protein [Devosia psychrophila]SFD21692.1 pfkB family carbohydrate kinase [Devosia psychrophila]